MPINGHALKLLDPVASASHPHRDSKRDPLSQLIKMQAIAYAKVNDVKVKDHLKPAFMNAWEKLEERRRILLGRPLPGQFRPESLVKPRKTVAGSSWSEPRQIVDVQSEPVKPGSPAKLTEPVIEPPVSNESA